MRTADEQSLCDTEQTPSPVATQEHATQEALASELFKRAGLSAAVGIIGTGIMAYPHMGFAPWQDFRPWLVAMLMIFFARILFARHALVVLDGRKQVRRLVNIEAFLCSVTGFGWGCSVYVFDAMKMDQPFYLRLMILAAAMSFVVSSMSVFVRVFLAYVVPIGCTVIAFILSHSYVEPKTPLVVCAVFYVAMLVTVAILNNRSIRKATADRLAVVRLTEELGVALGTELRANQALSRSAITDELTGVINRRGILSNLKTEIARCQRFGRPLAVLMIDIDHFKRINDTYGHAGGDLALVAVVESIQTALRDGDVLGRLGGEEFLVVLPDLAGSGAVAAAERLRERVEGNQVLLADGLVQITISIGIASHRVGDDGTQLLARADNALFSAKSNGRNRVESEIPSQSDD